ncbi:MAG: tetratricopeptide repeat protein [Zoogloeaceae bacterium]|nr:tetratricopeptide repeat protein [Zoogloeaceae bacterium]
MRSRHPEEKERAIAMLDEIVRRYEKDPSPNMREVVARALFIKGIFLRSEKKYAEAIALFNRITRRGSQSGL